MELNLDVLTVIWRYLPALIMALFVLRRLALRRQQQSRLARNVNA